MTLWQRRARLGVAAFGIACAVVVYFNIGERPHLETAPPITRIDPSAVLESSAGRLLQLRGLHRDFVVRFASSVTYADGTTKLIDVEIEAVNRNGRTFVVTAHEGRATRDNAELELARQVVLRESDGLELLTDQATFNKDTGIVRAAGAVRFSKGRMRGSGTGTTYTEHTDVLTIDKDAVIDVKAAGGSKAVNLRAGTATLDRMQHVLTVDGDVQALHGDQTTHASRATARLSVEDDVITFVELRGNANVEHGSGALASMSAYDIDLDYSDDGQLLERSVLRGHAAIATRGENGSDGRQFGGEVLDLTLAPDGSVTRVYGEGGVHMTLPQSGGAPSRTIRARSLDATGPEGQPLRDARFSDDVVFEEAAAEGGAPRVMKGKSLTLEMSADAISNAVFSGGTTFAEGDLEGTAAEARYVPGKETLKLSGVDPRGVPRLSDDRVTIDAGSIDVGLQDRRVVAKGRVKTSMKPGSAEVKPGRHEDASRPTRMPRLLRQDQQVNVTSEALTYVGSAGTAAYSGGVRLWQGDTEIRGDTIELEQERGDLTARGSARSTIEFDSGRSDGHGDQIQYVDADRRITYLSDVTGPKSEASRARLTGPQGDIGGRRIEVRLAPEESRVQQMNASGDVTATVDTRTVTGDTFSYRADDETYRVTGTAAKPMTVAESCNVWTGRTLTFSRSTDTMVIDGQTESRTQTKRRTSCP